jgi:hypothetical protein
LRLQTEKPAISAEEPSIQNAMNASQGSHWLAVVTDSGLLQVSVKAGKVSVSTLMDRSVRYQI